MALPNAFDDVRLAIAVRAAEKHGLSIVGGTFDRRTPSGRWRTLWRYVLEAPDGTRIQTLSERQTADLPPELSRVGMTLGQLETYLERFDTEQPKPADRPSLTVVR